MNDITWTPEQVTALDAVRRWLDAPAGTVPQVFRLFGYAGTGKTTLAKAVNEHTGYQAQACAFTGKAASVLSRKGIPASTVHSLIYTPAGSDTSHVDALRQELKLLEGLSSPGEGALQRLDAVRRALKEAEAKGGRPSWTLKTESELKSAPLVILDECSMVDKRMGEDLMSFGVKILALGDPAQLPPVQGQGYFTHECVPNVLLTNVRRNAGPILRLATAIREGRSFSMGEWRTEESALRIVDKVNSDMALSANQILCGTNAMRQSCNRRHRVLLGHHNHLYPQAGERLMCLKNDKEEGLLNGTQWIATMDSTEQPEGDIYMRIRPEEGGEDRGVRAMAELFRDDSIKVQWGSAQQFTFGYSATVHKSQGSEWDSVMLFNDWNHRATWKQWCYTGVTRAAKDLTLMMMD